MLPRRARGRSPSREGAKPRSCYLAREQHVVTPKCERRLFHRRSPSIESDRVSWFIDATAVLPSNRFHPFLKGAAVYASVCCESNVSQRRPDGMLGSQNSIAPLMRVIVRDSTVQSMRESIPKARLRHCLVEPAKFGFLSARLRALGRVLLYFLN